MAIVCERDAHSVYSVSTFMICLFSNIIISHWKNWNIFVVVCEIRYRSSVITFVDLLCVQTPKRYSGIIGFLQMVFAVTICFSVRYACMYFISNVLHQTT